MFAMGSRSHGNRNLRFSPHGGIPVRGDHQSAGRIVKGHPEGFHEGFANIYSDAAEAIVARRAGTTADPLALHFPHVEDGARGVKFVQAAIESTEANGAWTDCRMEFDSGAGG